MIRRLISTVVDILCKPRCSACGQRSHLMRSGACLGCHLREVEEQAKARETKTLSHLGDIYHHLGRLYARQGCPSLTTEEYRSVIDEMRAAGFENFPLPSKRSVDFKREGEQ